MNVLEKFEKYNNEHNQFEKVENKRTNKKDLHAFLLLDELFPRELNKVVISDSLHDQFYLDYASEEIASLTEENVLELVRCGVLYDSDEDSLFFFT